MSIALKCALKPLWMNKMVYLNELVGANVVCLLYFSQQLEENIIKLTEILVYQPASEITKLIQPHEEISNVVFWIAAKGHSAVDSPRSFFECSRFTEAIYLRPIFYVWSLRFEHLTVFFWLSVMFCQQKSKGAKQHRWRFCTLTIIHKAFSDDSCIVFKIDFAHKEWKHRSNE